jgi:hypothetical protein
MEPKTKNPEVLRAAALRGYLADEAAALAGTPNEGAGTYPFSPAATTTKVAKAYRYPRSRLVGLVADVYYAENGRRSPLPASAAKGPKSLAREVARRRRAGGRLGRWEVVAYSAEAAIGRPVALSAVRALAKAGGVDLDASYTGRGTRAGATKTRTDETAETLEGLGAEA